MDIIKKYKYLIVAVLIVLIAYVLYSFSNIGVISPEEQRGGLGEDVEKVSPPTAEELEEQKQALVEEFKKVSPPTEEELQEQKQALVEGFEKVSLPTAEELEEQKQAIQELKNNL